MESKEIATDYKKYKWFYTSSGKLVVGGKSADQNDELLKRIRDSEKDYWVAHTSHPGSPFCVIISEAERTSKKDLEECAIFTGCFSRAWKECKKSTEIHMFKASQLSKEKNMKVGMWRVSGNLKKIKVELRLVLVKQKKVYRAIPEKSAKKKDILLGICPGKVDKKYMMAKFALELKDDKLQANDLMAALPAGGVKIC
jgi:predicted ribosome quality control (RQC) complex YloA/Tae2 family protein